ncbi:MAG: hypothetical protein ACI8P3_001868 [Saprospiraceae bacterium]|jgi:hypothetical protein
MLLAIAFLWLIRSIFLRVCLNFVFDGEKAAFSVLTRLLLSRIAQLRGSKEPKFRFKKAFLQPKG